MSVCERDQVHHGYLVPVQYLPTLSPVLTGRIHLREASTYSPLIQCRKCDEEKLYGVLRNAIFSCRALHPQHISYQLKFTAILNVIRVGSSECKLSRVHLHGCWALSFSEVWHQGII